MSVVIPIDPHTDPRYRAFLEQHPEATVFHDPRWMSVLERSYGFRQSSLAAIDGERVVGILPLLEIRSRLTGSRAVSLPFSDYCAPLTEGGDVLDQFLKHCAELRQQRRWKFVEYRWAIDTHGRTVEGGRYKRHQLHLDQDAQKLLSTFDKSRTQRGIKKFHKSGGTVRQQFDWGGMQEFIRLNYQTRRKHGIPPQPDAFFRRLWEVFIKSGDGFVGVARLGGTTMAACVFLPFGDAVYYKYGASDESMLRYAPNYGVLWDAISWACEKGYRWFDLGRSDLRDEGLLDFKRRWGTVETDVMYARLGGNPVTLESSPLETLKPILRRVPVPVLRILGKILYSHVG